MKLSHSLALTLPLASSWAMGADLSVKFDVPQLNVAEYHKPYVAIWIENADQGIASNLAVLYDVKMKDRGGEKWVKDLRTWWRKAGRDATLPIDGVSGATRAPGTHTMKFDGAKFGIDKLAAGDYKLVVEAAREAGGREVVKVPFTWTGKGKLAANAAGKDELGAAGSPAVAIPAGATEVQTTAVHSRNETFVSANKLSDTALKPVGEGLEMIPLTNPSDLRVGEPIRARFHLDGKPVANLPFSIVQGTVKYRGSSGEQRLTTDAKGEASFTVPAANMYWLSAGFPFGEGKPQPGAKRYSYAATLEVLPQ